MATLDKDTYSKKEVHDLLQADRLELEKLKKQIKQLAAYIEQNNIGAPPAAAPRNEDLENAAREVKEVRRHVDNAIDRILSCASAMEKMLDLYQFAEKEKLVRGVTNILESCNVQDITAQRVNKVLELLGDREALAKKARREAKAAPGGVHLESGPQLPGGGMSQADIDKLLKS